MPCYHPVAMGKTALTMPCNRPCGACRGCRHEYARQWAVRCTHEASLYQKNCFITLTFEDKFLNLKGSLVKLDFQLFLKRLRRQFVSKCPFGTDEKEKRDQWISKNGIKYFHCGEYGTKNDRPHHHACLFNFDFPDKKAMRSKSKSQLYRSAILEDLWADPDTKESYGFSSIGALTYESACYVAQYCLKKISGEIAPGHYQGRIPEYTTQSRRPAIGLDWYNKYKNTDLYPRDYTVVNGIKGKIPKYYDSKYKLTNPNEHALLKTMRINKALLNPDNTPEKLLISEKIQKNKDKLYSQRSL